MSVTVRKGRRIIDTVDRPLHETVHGPAVRYRRRLWTLKNNSIDLDGPCLDEEIEPQTELQSLMEDGPDLAQEEIIRLPVSARVLVGAGPGSGKTHAACQRIAALINGGVPANRIWVVSFTRTAIVEFRNRIAAGLSEAADAASVRIATLDSHAWAIQSGFSPTAALTGDYNDNIRSAMERVLSDEDAAEYLGTLQHLIVDEAQDVLGIRAEFIGHIIDQLSPGAGVTVFADAAQSIFSFTEDENNQSPGASLLALLKAKSFQERELKRVHRTRDPRLRQIFTDVRRSLLTNHPHPQKQYENVRQAISRLAHAPAGSLNDLDLTSMSDRTLVLMRRRAEVLDRSSRNGGVQHRLRMSGLPVRLLPWLAAVFWDYTEGTKISWSLFEQRWHSRVQGAIAVHASTAMEAWSHLQEIAGINPRTIDLRVLRNVLGRSTPPMLFCSAEFGDAGPIIGTVHASKGREADEVHLFMPAPDPECDSPGEEARVAFVGATRARQRLCVGESAPNFSSSAASGRVFRFTRKGNLQVEIGRTKDLQAAGLVGQRTFASVEAAQAAQDSWCQQPLRQQLIARQQQTLDYEYELTDGDDVRLAVMSPQFKRGVEEVAQFAKRWPPARTFPYIRSLGLRSIVLPTDQVELETLHDPWRSSGFVIAPLLIGYSSGRFGGNG
ncbi:UvrD-helicase domain-containing protein [Lichenibacterium minor]|uniref:UvrD-helicase domain-containing protein n=1 Tax=Lichenibacterium minor TaxID=2316528 RepID=UPI0013EC8677|nr:UvrD-helicase domain-containing protein [Lichenibacterium minor]